LLVDFEPGRTVLDLSSLILDLEEALGRRVDVVEGQQSSSSPAGARIEGEAVPL
jgi:predicted nucleotidyltransferase